MPETTQGTSPSSRQFSNLDWLDSSIFHASLQTDHPVDAIETIIVALRAISAHLRATPDALQQGWTLTDLLTECRSHLLDARHLLQPDGHPHHFWWDTQVAPVVARIDAVLSVTKAEVQP